MFRLQRLFGLFALLEPTAHSQAISFLAPQAQFLSGTARVNLLHELKLADFNNDGRLDVAYLKTMSTEDGGVLLGHADGSFQPAAELRSTNGFRNLFIADFDGDGNLDLTHANANPSILPGDGKGAFGRTIEVPNCGGVSAVADLNGDGRPDLICQRSILMNIGANSFRVLTAKLPGTGILTSDFSGDGVLDIVAVDERGEVFVVPGARDENIHRAIPVAGFSKFTGIRSADFNGDGRLDLVGYLANRGIGVVLGNGDGSFSAVQFIPQTSKGVTGIADFNRDGKLDLLAGDAVLAGNGDGTFRHPVFIGVAPGGCDPDRGVRCETDHTVDYVTDINGDGLPDIVAGGWVMGVTSTRICFISVLINNSPGNGLLITGVSAANAIWPVTQGSLVTAFGSNLAPRTEAATTLRPLPTTLGGIRLHVHDRSKAEATLAPLLFVSPNQINFVLDAALPAATVSIERMGSPFQPSAMAIPLTGLAPGLFTVGPGIAAATAVRVSANGSQSPVDVFSCGSGDCTPIPIDVAGNPVYLSLFGTGIGNWPRRDDTACTIANRTILAEYVGPQNQLPGLDQINVLLPRELRGAGGTTVSCSIPTFEGAVRTNEARIAIAP